MYCHPPRPFATFSRESLHRLWMHSKSNCRHPINLVQLWTDGHQLTKSPCHRSLLTLSIKIRHCVKYNSLLMRLIACSSPVSKANQEWSVSGQHTGAWLTVHLKDVVDRFQLTDGCLLGISTDKASLNYSMTCELQSTLEDSGIEWPALRNHIPCMAHVIQLALGAFMSSLGEKGRTKSWEAHERDQQFGEHESIDIGKSQRLRKDGNARINKVSAMRPGLAKII